MKMTAKSCKTMSEVRSEIDRVDRALVALLTERLKYIGQAAHLKTSRDSVRDKDRVRDVLAMVRKHARALGGDEKMIDVIYRLLVEYSIIHEFDVFDAKPEKRRAINISTDFGD